MQPTGERWRLGRRPGLDGLRGVAVLFVVAYHVVGPLSLYAGGVVGVTVFFVLSGFLITSLLLEEDGRNGCISLRRFYARRARRLLPVLALMLGIGGSYAVVTGQSQAADVAAAAFYGANWWQVTGHQLGPGLLHTWTLSAEEQFYLLWPLVLIMFRRSRRLLWVTAFAAALVAVGRALLEVTGTVPGSTLYYSSGEALLAGCALGIWMHGRPAPEEPPRWAVPCLVGSATGLAFLRLPYCTAMVVATVLAVAIVWCLAAHRTTVPVLGAAVLRVVGQRSYGLYLWHIPLLLMARLFGVAAGLSPTGATVVGLVITACVVELSWRFVEQPFLRGSRQAASTFITAGPAMPPACVLAVPVPVRD